MRVAIKIGGALVTLYLLVSAVMLAVMLQPPLRFAQTIRYVPGPMFALLPFEPLWSFARGGRLGPGDAAPDFDLASLDKRTHVRLSSFQGRQPVVLVFGSYT
jgi:hypothetical protein